jgi:glutamate dehydrogenase (NAD(P)+)
MKYNLDPRGRIDEAIQERNIFLIPGFLANAGGVTCSYFEQVQSNMNYYWEKDKVLGKLDVKMTSAYIAVSELAKIKKLFTRDAAYAIAIHRDARACKDRGWVLAPAISPTAEFRH